MSSGTLVIDKLTRRKKISLILGIAIPAMIENILQTAVGFVDILFVSKLGIAEVAAVGVTNSILAVYMAMFMALGVGTSSLIARSIGSNDFVRAKAIARQSAWISTLLGVLFGLITLFFAEPLLDLMGAEPLVIEKASEYFRIVGASSLFISFMFNFGSILRAAGDTTTPMKVSVWVNLIHIVLDYILIFGFWKFAGIGLAGAAWATVIARLLGAFALYVTIRKSTVAFSLVEVFSFRNRFNLTELVYLSIPAAVERLVMRLGQVLYFGLIVHLGTTTFAAHMIAGNIELFSYMLGYGISIAATTLVGQYAGAKRADDAYSFGVLAAWIAVIMMSFGGVFLFFFSPWLATWFTTDKEVVDMVSTALRIDSFAQPALAVGLVLAGGLQGAGDTKSPMYSTAIGMWIVRILGIYMLAIHLEMGISGVWIAIAIDLFVRAIFLALRFRKQMTGR